MFAIMPGRTLPTVDRQAGYTKIAATIRKVKHDSSLLLAVLGLSNP